MNSEYVSRTNYFHVTDEKKFNQLANGVTGMIVRDSKDNTMYAFLADESMEWHAPASMSGEIFEEGNIFDEDGNPIDIEKIDDYEQIYDADGDCIFDRREGDNEWDKFTEELIKLIPENECFVYMHSGHEGHRYVDGFAQVVTHKGTKSVNLFSFVDNTVKEFLGPDATTKYTY